MKEINFTKVGCENFCNYTEPTEFEFKNGKITVLTGPNGAGKTAIFNIIPYASFGVTSKGEKGDDVVNNVVGKNCHVWEEFTIDDVSYRVDRYVKHYKFGDTVILSKDGVVYKKGHREVVPEMEKIFVSQKLLFNILFFGQKVKDFFTDLTDSEQKTIFRKVLQLDSYNLYYDETNKRLKQLQEDSTSLLNLLEIKKGILSDISDTIKKLVKEKTEFYEKKQEEIKLFEDKIFEVNSKISEVEIQIKEIDVKNIDLVLEQLNKDILQQENDIKTVSSDLNNILSDINNRKLLKETELRESVANSRTSIHGLKNQEINKIKDDHSKRSEEISSRSYSLKSKITITHNDIDKFGLDLKKLEPEKNKLESALKNDVVVCPSCRQKVGLDKVQHLSKELEDKSNLILSIKSEMMEKKKSVSLIEKEYEILSEEHRVFEKDYELNLLTINKKYTEEEKDLDLKLRNALSEVNRLVTQKINESTENIGKKKIQLENSLKDLNSKKNETEKVILKRNTLREQIQSLNTSIHKYQSVVEEKQKQEFNESTLNSSVSRSKEVLNEAKDLTNKIEFLNYKEGSLDFWKKAFSMTGIPAMLIDESIPFMNSKIREYLEMMGGRYIVSFDSMSETKGGEFRDKISVRVLDTITKSNSRKSFSGGQTRIVDIATILTLNDLQSVIQDMKINILLLDEIFDSLDDVNVTYVSSLLRQCIGNRSINIISHRIIDQIEYDEIYKLF